MNTNAALLVLAWEQRWSGGRLVRVLTKHDYWFCMTPGMTRHHQLGNRWYWHPHIRSAKPGRCLDGEKDRYQYILIFGDKYQYILIYWGQISIHFDFLSFPQPSWRDGTRQVPTPGLLENDLWHSRLQKLYRTWRTDYSVHSWYWEKSKCIDICLQNQNVLIFVLFPRQQSYRIPCRWGIWKQHHRDCCRHHWGDSAFINNRPTSLPYPAPNVNSGQTADGLIPMLASSQPIY